MAEYTKELATEFNFPHIDVYKQYCDGEHYGYEVRVQEGYVYYDTTANDTELQFDPETGEPMFDDETGLPIEVSVTYYYTMSYLPKNYNFANFPWVAVPRDSVNENYIHGDNNHEAM